MLITLLGLANTLVINTTNFWSKALSVTLDFEAEAGYCNVKGFNSGKVHYQLFSKKGRRMNDPGPEDPLLLWLGGGPGVSSYAQALTEFGPITIVNASNTTRLLINKHSWNQFSYLLFMDPLNVGFSFDQGNRTRPDQESNTSRKVAVDLASALKSFYLEHSSLASLPLFIGGIGYGGKIAVALADLIAREESGIALKGVVLNGAQVNPLVQNNNFDGMFYSAGVVDRNYRDSLSWYQTEYISSLMQRNFSKAYSCYHFIVENSTNIGKYAAGVRIDNYRLIDASWDNVWAAFLEKSKSELGVAIEVQFLEWNRAVHGAFVVDFSISYSEQLKQLLNKGNKVLSINGANDLSHGPASAQLLIKYLNWKHAREYRDARKQIVHLVRSVVGWQKSARNLMLAVVYDSGKHVAMEQPETSSLLLQRFMSSQVL